MEDLTVNQTTKDTKDKTIEQGQTPPPPASKVQRPASAVPDVPDGIGVDELKKLNKKRLAAICKKEGLPSSGTKDELINRLIAKRFGTSRRYVGPLTTCKVCGAGVFVKSTEQNPLGDGRMMVTRHIKCKGKNAHRYPLKEIV